MEHMPLPAPREMIANYAKLAGAFVACCAVSLVIKDGNGDNPEITAIREQAKRTDKALEDAGASEADRETVRDGHRAIEGSVRRRTLPPTTD